MKLNLSMNEKGLIRDVNIFNNYLNESSYQVRSYKIHFLVEDNTREHNPRFKFIHGKTELGFIQCRFDGGQYYAALSKSMKWDRSVTPSVKSNIIDTSIALAEFMGDICYNYYRDHNLYRPILEESIKRFNSLNYRDFKELVKKGKPKFRMVD